MTTCRYCDVPLFDDRLNYGCCASCAELNRQQRQKTEGHRTRRRSPSPADARSADRDAYEYDMNRGY